MKKKICFLTDSIFSFGGVQRVTAVIARLLAAEHDVTIVTFDRPEAKDTTLYNLSDAPTISYRFFSYPAVKPLKHLLCKCYSAVYRKMHLPWRWASKLYGHSSFPSEMRGVLLSELHQGHYDTIVGVHAPIAARLATLKSHLDTTRCIGWIHNSFEALYGPTSLYIGPELKRHYVFQLQRLDETVVLCHHDAQCYTNYDARFTPTVVYNPLTLQAGQPSAGTSKRFLAVGRFSHRHKGFDLLIDAFHRFAQDNREWTLHLVGEGPEEPLYRKMIAQYHLEERVVIHPFTRHIQDYYSQAQVYVLSSRWEGFGLVLVEAMAHGLPVVSSNLPTSEEIMGDFGLYFDNGNVEQLAQRLHDATCIDWQQKSAQAATIVERFSPERIAQQWKKIL